MAVQKTKWVPGDFIDGAVGHNPVKVRDLDRDDAVPLLRGGLAGKKLEQTTRDLLARGDAEIVKSWKADSAYVYKIDNGEAWIIWRQRAGTWQVAKIPERIP
jgi:hypothetical protein